MRIDGSQIRQETVTGEEILDESVTGDDIKDGTVQFVDLSSEISDRILANTKNIMINSTELRALTKQDLDPDLSIFVDSFDDESNIDPQSTNFEVDVIGGFVSLVQGGDLTLKETTKEEFDLGTFSNMESFLDVGGDGAIRKERSVIGNQYTYPNYPVGTTITIEGEPVPISTISGTFIEGVESASVPALFENTVTPSKTFETVLPAVLDLSSYKYITFSYLKQTQSLLRYRLRLIDSVGGSHTFPQRLFVSYTAFQEIKEDLTTISGVDLTDITTVQVLLDQDVVDQNIFDLFPQNGNLGMEIRDTREMEQQFVLDEDTDAQIIKLTVKWENVNNIPADSLYIAIANAFGTTLGVGILEPIPGQGAQQEYYISLDNSFRLKAGIRYAILAKSPGSANGSSWKIARTANNTFPDFLCIYNGRDQSYSAVCGLYKPQINETIYFDNLQSEAETTYINTANEFISQAINLGLTPDSFDIVNWIESIEGADTVQIRIRTAINAEDLPTAQWSTVYNNGDDISTVPVNPWIQYQVLYSGGDTTSSKIFEEVTIEYSTVPGVGNAIIISATATTDEDPESFILLWDVADNSGTSMFYVSRDEKVTWQNVPPAQEGEYVTFTSDPGNKVHIKAVLTGDAKLYSWSLACNKEFL